MPKKTSHDKLFERMPSGLKKLATKARGEERANKRAQWMAGRGK